MKNRWYRRHRAHAMTTICNEPGCNDLAAWHYMPGRMLEDGTVVSSEMDYCDRHVPRGPCGCQPHATGEAGSRLGRIRYRRQRARNDTCIEFERVFPIRISNKARKQRRLAKKSGSEYQYTRVNWYYDHDEMMVVVMTGNGGDSFTETKIPFEYED